MVSGDGVLYSPDHDLLAEFQALIIRPYLVAGMVAVEAVLERIRGNLGHYWDCTWLEW